MNNLDRDQAAFIAACSALALTLAAITLAVLL